MSRQPYDLTLTYRGVPIPPPTAMSVDLHYLATDFAFRDVFLGLIPADTGDLAGYTVEFRHRGRRDVHVGPVHDRGHRMTIKALTGDRPLSYRAGPVIVRVQNTRVGVYRLTVEHASTGHLVDELCRSYPTETETRTRARGVCQWFNAGLTIPQVVDLVAVFDTTVEALPPCEVAA